LFELSEKKVLNACERIEKGSIFLLHDCHKLDHEKFCYQLDILINRVYFKGYNFSSIKNK